MIIMTANTQETFALPARLPLLPFKGSRPGTATSTASRPGTGASAASVSSARAEDSARARASSTGSGCTAPTGAATGRPSGGYSSTGSSLASANERKLAPGAIRRAGSVPVRRAPGRSFSPAVQPKAPAVSAQSARPVSACSRPDSRAASEAADPGIDACIPSDSE
ncbi:unnamed protein product, partial [Polarella glacialis]